MKRSYVFDVYFEKRMYFLSYINSKIKEFFLISSNLLQSYEMSVYFLLLPVRKETPLSLMISEHSWFITLGNEDLFSYRLLQWVT